MVIKNNRDITKEMKEMYANSFLYFFVSISYIFKPIDVNRLKTNMINVIIKFGINIKIFRINLSVLYLMYGNIYITSFYMQIEGI